MRRGIGMIEMMMVLAIIAIVTMMALPSWGSDAPVRADAAARLLRAVVGKVKLGARCKFCLVCTIFDCTSVCSVSCAPS